MHLIIPNTYIKLVLAPHLEALDCIEKLRSTDIAVQKKMIFQLQKLVKDVDLAREFIAKQGVGDVITLLTHSTSLNLSAYALTTVQNLLDYPETLSVTPFPFEFLQLVCSCYTD